MVSVVQLVRTPDCGSGGRQFESVHLPHLYPWCNGSIRGSNPLGQSSNLWGRAIHIGEYSVTGSGFDCKSSALGSAGSSPASPTNMAE